MFTCTIFGNNEDSLWIAYNVTSKLVDILTTRCSGHPQGKQLNLSTLYRESLQIVYS